MKGRNNFVSVDSLLGLPDIKVLFPFKADLSSDHPLCCSLYREKVWHGRCLTTLFSACPVSQQFFRDGRGKAGMPLLLKDMTSLHHAPFLTTPLYKVLRSLCVADLAFESLLLGTLEE